MSKNLLVFLSISFFIQAQAQVDSLKMNFDLRTRAELNNGQKTLIAEGVNASTNVYSRARMGLDYYYENLEVYFAAQDVRVWGETPTTTNKNQDFILYEAWAKYQFTPNIGVKVGRQSLSYDDERLVGALDWAMQGRSFDAAKGVFNLDQNSTVEAVVTYNSNADDASKLYNVVEAGERVKTAQLLYYKYKNPNKLSLSFIALNTVMQNVNEENYDMITLGGNFKKEFNKLGLSGSVYYQVGKNTQAQDKSAYQFSINADYAVTSSINLTLGTEWLSGRSYDTPPTRNRSFSPLYGTNHKFNGFMDYFYVGNYFNSYGLNDYYLKSKFLFNKNSFLVANIHAFTTNGKLADSSSYLGTELDLVYQYKIMKFFTLNLGHSFMFAGDSMEIIKSVENPKDLQTWSWVGLQVNPSFRLK